MTKWLVLLVLVQVGAGAQAPREIPEKNPLEGNPDAIRTGMGMFRVRCADCHGMDATGVRGPDLTQVWASGRTDHGLFRTVRSGVPGTEMPAIGVRSPDEDVWKILAYLRTLAAPAPTDPPRGDAANGERIFRAQCTGCHRANGRGGRLGPDLSRVGLSRTRASLVRRIRGAVEGHSDNYEPVTITTASGAQIQALKKNEDLFSVQVMDSRERIQGYLKEDVRAVTDETKSRMPAYDVSQLSERDLDDLLAYLNTLRGFNPEVQQ
jgi:putative heme-binding domain-containing protein